MTRRSLQEADNIDLPSCVHIGLGSKAHGDSARRTGTTSRLEAYSKFNRDNNDIGVPSFILSGAPSILLKLEINLGP